MKISREELNLKFCDESWNNSSNFKKTQYIYALIDDEKDKMSRTKLKDMDVDLSDFKNRFVLFYWKNLPEETYGESGGNTISLNKKLLNNEEFNGRSTYYVIMHELQHIFQTYIIDKSIKEPTNESFKNYVFPFKINRTDSVNLSLINPKLDGKYGTLFINNINDLFIDGFKDSEIKSLTYMFYTLRKMEADAFEVGFKKGMQFSLETNTKVDYTSDKIDIEIKKFKQRYNCTHFTKQMVFDTIDSCFSNIYYGEKAQTDLQEIVMYDLSTVAAFCKKPKQLREKCLELLDSKIKNELFSDNPHYNEGNDPDIILSNDYGTSIYFMDDFFASPIEVQIKNTNFIIYVAANDIDALNDIDCSIFKSYCLENVKEVLENKDAKEGLTNLYGKEFYDTLLYCNEKLNGVTINDDLYSIMNKRMNTEIETRIETDIAYHIDESIINVETTMNDMSLNEIENDIEIKETQPNRQQFETEQELE